MNFLPHHPLADLFPLIEGKDFDELVASIAENGLREPIVLCGEKILDGRNRYRACLEAAVEPRFETLPEGVDPLRFVIDHNLRRRHLTDDQRRMVAARIANLPQGAHGAIGDMRRKDAAEMLAVDPAGVARARRVVTRGAEELQAAVDQRRVTVRMAADLAALPVEAQREIMAFTNPRLLREAARQARAGGLLRDNGERAVMAARVEPEGLDFFPTPPWATRALIERVLPVLGLAPGDLGAVWDPACGEGHITGVFEEYPVRVVGSDIHDYSAGGRAPPALQGIADFLAPDAAIEPVADWIVTNPPFEEKALAFALKALAIASAGVALFVPLRWLETVERYEKLFRDNPPTLIAFFVERVNLCKGRWDPDGSTATAYVWLVWQRGRAPLPPFWIPPGCREALTRPGDRERFTAHPVLPIDEATPEGGLRPTSEAEEAAVGEEAEGKTSSRDWEKGGADLGRGLEPPVDLPRLPGPPRFLLRDPENPLAAPAAESEAA